jgi:TRAP-type C4-dicarboxylate transport system substrate-binding protein
MALLQGKASMPFHSKGEMMNSTLRIVAVVAATLTLTAASAAATRLKVATLSPEGSVWMKKMRAGAEEVERRTEKRVRFRYYPGGVMGSDSAVLRKIRIGQLHGGAVVAGSLSSIYPDNQVYAMPLKFRSFGEVDFVRSQLDAVIAKGLEDAGLVTFGFAEGGFAYIMSDTPVHTVEELRAKKVWIPDTDSAAREAVNVFGVTPIPLPLSDVRAGLQTGLIDTVTTSPVGALVLQWHTQVKYVTKVPFIYLYGVMAIDKRAFSRIAPQDQVVVREVMGRVFQEIGEQNRSDNDKAITALKKQGITFIQPEPAQLDNWKRLADSLPDKMIAEGKLSAGLVGRMEELLKQYRNEQAQ